MGKGEIARYEQFLLFPQCFQKVCFQGRQKVSLCGNGLKVALQIFGLKFYKNTKKSSLYFQSLLIFIHKTPVVKNHATTREIRELLWPRSRPTRITVYFYTSSLLIYMLEIHRRKFQTASDEDIMENYYMSVMLWNLSVISHLIFPQCFFMPPYQKLGGILFYRCLSVCLSVCTNLT